MQVNDRNILSILEFVKVDSFSVVCHFRCKETGKRVVASVPFEPYEGKIELSWLDIISHPFDSYQRYYHTPITIYAQDIHHTIVLKAFKKVSHHFRWSGEKNSYIYIR